MLTDRVEKPHKRGVLRSYLGKEYYILKRKLIWIKNRKSYARPVLHNDTCCHSIIQHRSFLLRPLKDVDMLLQYNKVTNLRLAIANIDGTTIRPGQLFSIWKLVGRPTVSKGYLDGLVLHNGKISKGCGGGLCQLGNLLYWMALHSELDIIERWRHGYDVFPDINRTIPFACGATLSYNYVDLQLKNNTNNTYRINLWLDDEYLNGELLADSPPEYTFEIYETDHMFKSQWWGGYTRHNKIWRKRVCSKDKSYKEELVTENHAIMMYSPLLTD